MYGTVARIRVKAGRFDDLLTVMKSFDERNPDVKGSVGSTLYRLDKDPNELILVVVFDDKQSYLANADDPSTDDWYREVRALLDSDPEWNDGEIVLTT